MKTNILYLVIIVYWLFHLYVWYRIKTIFSLGWRGQSVAFVTLMLLCFTFMLSRLFNLWGWFPPGQILFRLGSTWLGLFFIFFCLKSLLWIVEVATGWRLGRDRPAVWSATVGCAVLINVFGYFEAQNMTVTRLTMTTPSMATDTPPVNIMQISDAHYGQWVSLSRHEWLLEQVQKEQPDLIVVTGDFIDFEGDSQGRFMDQWRSVRPPLGKLAVLGNHETLSGIPASLAWLERGGFKVLRNEVVTFDGFSVIGWDDPTVSRYEIPLDRIGPIHPVQPGECMLLLHHQPVWPPHLAGAFDLGLAGHTHGGQIFPFGLVVFLTNGVLSGLQSTSWGGWYFISRGAGTWGPPVRLGAPPEVTLLTLSHGKKKNVSFAQPDP
ncbi:MAG: metallophosphoesterase [Magnetococcales bacterium]|nr:metallophosphoesterase [Magnetococcales bacterium]MBF0150691.1 metallophosphoesterase [Magnetococcales bacterium]